MKIELLDVKNYIDINSLEEVTSPVLFERGGTPNPEGLISNRIFGVNVKDRKEIFAYISLHGYFFHPHIYKALQRLYRNVDKIIIGELYVSLDNGLIIPDEGGETGLQFFYNNWEKIKWEKTTGMRNERIDLLTKSKKSESFIDKQIVIPPFYRDINSSDDGGGGGDTSPINNMYAKLIRICSLLDDDNLFDFTFNNTNYNIQQILVDIYNYFKEKLEKKNGIIRKYLMGKSPDYCTRSVIVGANFHGDTPYDNLVDFTHSGVPLDQCCVLMYVPMVYWLRRYFEREFINEKYNKSLIDMTTGELTEHYELKNPESYFTDEYIKKMMDRFIKDPSSRYDLIEIPVLYEHRLYMNLIGRYYNSKNKSDVEAIMHRPMTWTDLLFICATDVAEDKYLLTTRYPVLNVYGSMFTKVRVLTTAETIQVEIAGIHYKWYPKIDLDLTRDEVSIAFIPCVMFSNSYLAGLDGDYDGDQVTNKILWSQEANVEAEEIMYSKSNILSITGKNMRTCNNEIVQTLFTLTHDPE